MAIVNTKLGKLPTNKRPEKTVIRWRRWKGQYGHRWSRARANWGNGPTLSKHNHHPGHTGFHVYRYKKDAGSYPTRVEVAHRLDVGQGDGSNFANRQKVETYQWIRRA